MAAAGQTVINPDVGAARGLGTTIGRSGSVFTVDGGTRSGANLFHSFDAFSLAAGDTARWVRGAGDGAAIANVVNRVTGGQVSTISGTLDSTALPNAAFWFVNPAGIVFGAGAVVNVPSAAHFSTASELRFDDGATFAVATPDGSTLSMAAPEAFGFVGGEGAIGIQGVGETFSSDQFTLSFTAPSLQVADSTVFSRGLDLIGVGAGPAVVSLADPLAGPHTGLVELFNSALIVVGTDAGGSLRVGGGQVDVETTGFDSDGNIFVDATESLFANFSSFGVFSVTREAAGVISLRAPEIGIARTAIDAGAIAEGAPGRILIDTGDLLLSEVDISADAKDGVGAEPGLIAIRSTGDIAMFSVDIRSNANGAADGGQILLDGRDIALTDTAIQSDTLPVATGNAGGVGITAETLSLAPNTSISSTTNGDGEGGGVIIGVGTLHMETASAIRSDTEGAGKAGVVAIEADTIDMDGASITSRAQEDVGDAGAVAINVGQLTMVDSTISSGTDTRGAGGQVVINAEEIVLDGARRDFTGISSDTLGSGKAGDVAIQTKTMVVRNGAYISSDTFDEGDAGNVAVIAEDLRLENGGYISSDTLRDGTAGHVFVQAGKLTILGGEYKFSYISSDSFSPFDAGGILIQAGSLVVDGGNAYISSDALAGGEGGKIGIAADSITLQNFGSISSQTNSIGNAGGVAIEAKTVTLASGGAILSEATRSERSGGIGNAGEVKITADTLTVGDRSRISTSTAFVGNAGTVEITAKSVTVDGGVISSSAERGSSGAPRTLTIEAETLSLLHGGAISTLSSNPNPAGLIVIDTSTLLVDGQGSIISSENQSGNPDFGGPGPGGDAGGILIGADNLTISNGGRISTNSFAGAAGDILVVIERPGLFTLEGKDAPGVIQTSSGPGTGGKIGIADPLAIVSNGGAILALGQQAGANVIIQSRYFINSTDRSNVVSVDGDFQLQTGLYDVSSGTVSRELSVLDASKVLRGQCPAARSTGAVSQLITRPVGPYAREGAVDVLERPAGAAAAPPSAGAPGGCR